MHIHELNPRKTIIAVAVFVVILIVGFVTMKRPLMSYELGLNQSVKELSSSEQIFTPSDLQAVLASNSGDVVLFDIRDNFVFGQGHIPGAENLSAHDLASEESIERLEDLKAQNKTVVLYGEDQLEANGPVMLFRQVGFDNVKVLAGGYAYYKEYQNELASAENDSIWTRGVAKYNFAEKAAPKDGAVLTTTEKPTIEITRRQKTEVAAGGC